jgi:hypothetical protein
VSKKLRGVLQGKDKILGDMKILYRWAAVTVLFSLLLITCVALSRGRSPNATYDLLKFAEVYDISKIKRFAQDGRTYYLVICQHPVTFLSSGPPAYIFNSEGRCVDWVGDFGDATPFRKRWKDFPGATDVSIREINLLE